MKYNCIIVDDEPLAIEVIKSHTDSLGIFNVVAECRNAIEAFHALKSAKVDLMFLDIQMPGMKGTDFLRTLVDPPKVILTTAFRDYAIEGFELNVVDYLLKPVSHERFVKAVDKFLLTKSNRTEDKAEKGFIYLNINKNVHRIRIDDIIYAESVKDYLTLHTTDGSLEAKHTISSFEDLLPTDRFIRIHRSFIVAVARIKSFNSHCINVGKKELPIGESYQAKVLGRLNYPNLKS